MTFRHNYYKKQLGSYFAKLKYTTGLFSLVMLSACIQNNPSSLKQKEKTIPFSHVQSDTGAINKAIQQAYRLIPDYIDSSLSLLQKALQESKKAGFSKGMGTAYKMIGIAHLRKGDLKPAEDNLKTSLSYFPKDTLEQAKIRKSMGSIYQIWGEYEKALSCYKEIMDLDRHADSLLLPVWNSAYYNFVNILISLKRYKEALYYSQELISRIRDDKDEWLLANCYNNMAIIYNEWKNYEQCDIYAQKCVEVCTRNHFNDLLTMVLANRSQNYADRKDTAGALQYLASVKKLQKDLLPQGGIIYYGTAGDVLLSLGRYKEAIYPLRNALRIAQEHHGVEVAMDIKYSLARAYTHTGNYKNATEQYEGYIALKDSFQSNQTRKNVSAYEVKFRTAEKDKELLTKQIDLLHQQATIEKKDTLITGISVGALVLLLIMLNLYLRFMHKQHTQKKDIEILKQEAQIGNLQAFINGEDKERERIGHELHDGISCMLSAINMNLEAIRQRHINISSLRDLDEVIKMLRNTGVEIRRTAHDLMPDPIQNRSLPDAIQTFLKGINKTEGFKVQLSSYGDFSLLNRSLATVIYRMVQELIHNTIKHASASFAAVQMNKPNDTISIVVEDNGKGFNPDAIKTGIGLAQITARIKAMDGHLSINSKVDAGTTIYIEINAEKANKLFIDEHKSLYN